MPKPLVKHPLESDTYAMGFSRRLADGESLSPAVASPMLLLNLVGVGAAGVTITRVDGAAMGAGDLAASGVYAMGTQVLFVLSGGNDGVKYQLQTLVTSNLGAAKVGYGQLLVTSSLPQP